MIHDSCYHRPEDPDSIRGFDLIADMPDTREAGQDVVCAAVSVLATQHR